MAAILCCAGDACMKRGTWTLAKTISVFLGTVFVLVGAVAGVAILDGPPEVRGADVDPVELLAGIDDLPKVPFVRVAEKKGAARHDPYSGAESSAVRGWGVRHACYLFDERVLKFSNVASAKAEFQMAPYGRVFNDSIYWILFAQ